MDISVTPNSPVHAMIVFRQAARTIERNTQQAFRQFGMTATQFGILDVLYCKGDKAICELKEKLLGTSGNMTVVLRNMERNGWITRQQSHADKRRCVFTVTAAGRQLYEQVLPAHRQEIDKVFGQLSDADRTALISILKQFKNIS